MNILVQYYLIFALGTAIVGSIMLFRPVMQALKEIRPSHNIIDYTVVAYCTFFTIMFVFAPLVFISTVYTPMGDRFQKTMLNTFLENS